MNIDTIINETLDNLLSRKADYDIILKYSIFLLEIGRIDKAITRLQIFNFDPRFMNNGELLFYKGIYEFILLENEEDINDININTDNNNSINNDFIQFNSSNNNNININKFNSFLLNFNKSIGLIKKDDVLYISWILNFLQRNFLVK
jgi:hypothetical protein